MVAQFVGDQSTLAQVLVYQQLNGESVMRKTRLINCPLLLPI
jgi:hypothetical protein